MTQSHRTTSRSPHSQRGRAVYAATLLAMLVLMAAPSTATVTHQTFLEFDDDFDPFNGVNANAGTRLTAPTPDDLTTDVFDTINDPGGLFRATASIGRFGALGIEARQLSRGELTTQVFIADDGISNLLGTAQRIEASFIIDGGEFTLVAGDGGTGMPSFLEWQLDITSRIDGRRAGAFQAGGRLESSDFSRPTLTTFGTDIGAAFTSPTSSTVEIPFGFYSFEIGTLPANGVLELEYLVTIRSEAQVAEVVNWQFSDPLMVDGEGPVTIDMLPIPEPGTALLVLGGLVGLATRRRPNARATRP